jgi:polyhydroxyalkanoate synthase
MHQRRGPRPLALHLAAACAAWGGPDAGMTERRRLAAFLAGVRRYHEHPFRRPARRRPVLWRNGAVRLLDGRPEGGFPVLVAPSLVNRAAILDLLPGSSFVDRLAAEGFRPLLIDWGEPASEERRISLDELIEGRFAEVLDMVRESFGRPVVLGYCMGGTLALGLAACFAPAIAGLGLLAAPFAFHAHGFDGRSFRRLVADPVSCLAGAGGALPVDLIQGLFASIDLLEVPSKFARFAGLDPDADAARRFVAIEDWLNDGVPLGAEIARACLTEWYAEDWLARGRWRVGGRPVRPETLTMPVLLAVPERDRIVPPASSVALANHLPRRPTIVRPPGGHIAMITSPRRSGGLYPALLAWLEKVAAMQKGA